MGGKKKNKNNHSLLPVDCMKAKIELNEIKQIRFYSKYHEQNFIPSTDNSYLKL